MVIGTTLYDIRDKIQYIHLSNTGLGLPPVDVYQETGPLQDGATYTDYRLQARDITLVIGNPNTTFDQYMSTRKQLYNIFKPKRDNQLSFRVTFDNGDIRQLDVVYIDGLGADGNDKSGNYHKYAIGLRAHDPTWYDPTIITTSFNTETPQGLSIPMPVPFHIGAATLRTAIDIQYPGTFDSYPIITVIGEAEDFTITNEATGDFIKINGTIPDTERRVIDTRYGRKTIVDINGVSKIADYEGDLATFRLVAAEDDSATRLNRIRVDSDVFGTNMKVFVQYYNRYIGV